jgi:hypothetical protein
MAQYEDEKGTVYSGNVLMTIGLPMPLKDVPNTQWREFAREYDAFQIHLVKRTVSA